MMRFKFLLLALTVLLKKTAWRNADCKAYLRGKHLVFQIQTHDGVGRYFTVRDGKISSSAGLADNPAFTLSFVSGAKGYEILSAKDSQNAFLRGVGQGDLLLSGDFVEIMWFQGLTGFLQPEATPHPYAHSVYTKKNPA